MKDGRSHIPALDGVRGLAVLMVFVYHYGGGARSSNPLLRTVGETVKLGWSGVTLFFVLSGFLITGILWRSREEERWWRTFYIRRILRIFPLYYFTLLIVFVSGLVFHRVYLLGTPLMVYAFYLQGLLTRMNLGAVFPFTMGHYWSLAVEEHFYLEPVINFIPLFAKG